MKVFRLTIYRRGVAPVVYPALARNSCEALINMLDVLGDLAGTRVTVRPA